MALLFGVLGACTSGDGRADPVVTEVSGEEATTSAPEGTGWCDELARAAETNRRTFPAKDPVPAKPCEDSKPILQDGLDGPVPTGLERCADGRIHRVSAETCLLPADTSETCPRDNDNCDYCSSPNQRCNAHPDYKPYYPGDDGGLYTKCYCVDFGATDADCPPSQVAVCAGINSDCVPSTCHLDSDCGEGFLCAADVEPPRCDNHHPTVITGFHCETAADTCRVASDCGACDLDPWGLTCSPQGQCNFFRSVCPDD